jgi:uncharacterized protein YjbI with pentapeptide repeats
MAAPDPIPDLLEAVNKACGKAFALWITFLTAGTYLAITIGTTTHLQLLLAGPVKLPLLGVDLPLFAFYEFAPPLYLVLHLYVLMQLYLLARLLCLFDEELRMADMIEQDRRRVRGQLDKFVFTQFLIGAPQDGIIRLFLLVAVWLSFVAGPILLLLGFQLRFLPYHSTSVTYTHRATLLLDLALLLLMWPRIAINGAQPVQRLRHLSRAAAAGLMTIIILAFSAFVATVPREWADQGNLRLQLLSRTLVLPGERLVEPDEDKLSKVTRTLALRSRDLREANFLGSDIRKADLKQSDLRGAKLDSADLGGADLTLVDLRGATLSGANLSGVRLYGANLAGVDLGAATLSDANLSYANLTGANLIAAKLNGANLRLTNLSNTDLTQAHLDSANLRIADLRGAKLLRAKLSGAFLIGADLTSAFDLNQDQLNEACGTNTKLPPGLTLKPCTTDWVERKPKWTTP